MINIPIIALNCAFLYLSAKNQKNGCIPKAIRLYNTNRIAIYALSPGFLNSIKDRINEQIKSI